MISKTKIRKRTERKRNPEVVETINLANKNPQWEKTIIKEGDTVELVSFVGGGS